MERQPKLNSLQTLWFSRLKPSSSVKVITWNSQGIDFLSGKNYNRDMSYPLPVLFKPVSRRITSARHIQPL